MQKKKSKLFFKQNMSKDSTINLNPENIEEAKEILEQLKKTKFLQKIKQNPL